MPDEIEERVRRVAEAARVLRMEVRGLHEARQRAAGRAQAEATREAAIGRLTRLEGVEVARQDETRVEILTSPIAIDRPTGARLLGSFWIVLDPETGVHVRGVDGAGPRAEWPHPHVQGGIPCLGNLRPAVEKLIGEDDLETAVSVMVAFLRSYDPTTAYCAIELWPLAS